MLESGYIKLYRSLLSWEWYNDINTTRLFIHLLLTVNHYDQKWRGMDIKRGQKVCSYRSLAEETGLSEKNIRTAIKHLISTGEVAYTSTSKFGLVTVKNYDEYQEAADETAGDGQASGSQGAVKGQQSKKARKQEYISPKEKIDKKEIPLTAQQPKFLTFGEFGKVKLTQQRYDALVQRLGKDSAEEYIARLDAYIASKGKRYNDHYATILNWWRKDNPPSVEAKTKTPKWQDGGGLW